MEKSTKKKKEKIDIRDILLIDQKIQDSFKGEQEKLPKYQSRMKELKLTLKSLKGEDLKGKQNKAKKEVEKNILELQEEIDKISDGGKYNLYLAETAELVEKFRKILKVPIKLSFMGKEKENKDSKEKKDVIDAYIKIAQKYYNIPLKQTDKDDIVTCDNCENKKDFIIDENSYICEECGAQQDNKSMNNTSYKDADRVNISAKYSYDRKVHFRDCFLQYQGKQNCTIEQKVYDDLEDNFEKHYLLIGDKNTKKEIRFSKITKEHVLMFLKELGYSKHYENVILIHYNMTGKKPDDISYLEDRLLSDFDELVETYDKHFKNKVDRVNFISTQFVLYQLLQRHKHPCKKEDFVILKTVERKEFHDNITSELFAKLHWSFYPTYG